MKRPRFRYCVYGVVIVSDIPLALPECFDCGRLGEVECQSAPASLFLTATGGATFDAGPDSWHRYASLPDGASYVRWEGVGEFLVAADGRSITCRVEGCSTEPFQVYMLGQALSFALVKQRFEPLHATAVVVDDAAVAFLGKSGFGKSSLAACFLAAGHRLLTDDLLVLDDTHGRFLAYPGPPRIKLFPKVARLFLGPTVNGAPMNDDTAKLILPIEDHRRCTAPFELRAIYSLAAPRDACRRDTVSSEALARNTGFIELVKATFNRRLVSRERLARQFDVMARLTGLVPVRRLRYPRTIDRLKEVRDVVLADLACGASVVDYASV
jgi:hypothetical protein